MTKEIPIFPLEELKIRNHKCFSKDQPYQGLDEIKPINIIIGKNNSGKSQFTDLLANIKDDAHENLFHSYDLHIKLFPSYSDNLTDVIIKFSNTIKYINLEQKIIDANFEINKNYLKQDEANVFKFMASLMRTILDPYVFLSLKAERDINPEGGRTSVFAKNGNNFTSMFRSFLGGVSHINIAKYIKNEFINHLNSIVSPEIKIDEIEVKQWDYSGKPESYELFFKEENKELIPLSDSGSGLKTILLVLAQLYLIPKVQNKKPWQYVYIFEELENNLHPAIEKRLLNHIKEFVEKNNSHVFLNTHSHYALDIFKSDESAQILKLTNENGYSIIEKVDTWSKTVNLIDDMGVKASDLLQSNYIVWVEGPSDRIYLNKWIELFDSEKKLKENIHYQVLFTGGSNILWHDTTIPDDNSLNDFISLLKVNKNFSILMDSDKKNETDNFKKVVDRIKDEVKNLKDLPNIGCWITKGREVENYIPNKVLRNFFSNENLSMDKYCSIAEFYKEEKSVKNFVKTSFAQKIIKDNEYTLENLKGHLDLKLKMDELISKIKNANGIS